MQVHYSRLPTSEIVTQHWRHTTLHKMVWQYNSWTIIKNCMKTGCL